MRQRVTGIAALLILVLILPLSRACATVAHAVQDHHACCEHQAMPDACCNSSSHLCCAAHLPVDSASYPVQGIVPLILPPQTTAFHYDRLHRPESPCLASSLPVQHAPPGLLVAATVVLRI